MNNILAESAAFAKRNIISGFGLFWKMCSVFIPSAVLSVYALNKIRRDVDFAPEVDSFLVVITIIVLFVLFFYFFIFSVKWHARTAGAVLANPKLFVWSIAWRWSAGILTAGFLLFLLVSSASLFIDISTSVAANIIIFLIQIFLIIFTLGWAFNSAEKKTRPGG